MNEKELQLKVDDVLWALHEIVKERLPSLEGRFLTYAPVIAWENVHILPAYVFHTFPSPDVPEINKRGVELQYVPKSEEVAIVLHRDYTKVFQTQMFMTIGYSTDADPASIAQVIYNYIYEDTVIPNYQFPSYTL